MVLHDVLWLEARMEEDKVLFLFNEKVWSGRCVKLRSDWFEASMAREGGHEGGTTRRLVPKETWPRDLLFEYLPGVRVRLSFNCSVAQELLWLGSSFPLSGSSSETNEL